MGRICINGQSPTVQRGGIVLPSEHPSVGPYVAALMAASATVSGAKRAALNQFFANLEAEAFRAALARLALPVWGSAAANAIDVMHPTQSMTWIGTVSHAAKRVQSVGKNGHLDLNWIPAAAGCTPFTQGMLVCVDELVGGGGELFGGGVDGSGDMYMTSALTLSSWNSGFYVSSSGVYSGGNVRIGYGTGARTKMIRLAPGASVAAMDSDYIPSGGAPGASMYCMAYNSFGSAFGNSSHGYTAFGGLQNALTDAEALAGAIALDRLITSLRA